MEISDGADFVEKLMLTAVTVLGYSLSSILFMADR
jgi:hypothetical protein